MARQRHYRNPADPGVCVFATTTVLDFVPVFAQGHLAGDLKSKMADAILPRLDALTKGKFSMQIGLNRRVFWQRSFRGFEVEGDKVFWQKAEYIHLNPVRRELVLYPEDYGWSSARLLLAGKWDEERGLCFALEDLEL